MEIRKRDKRKTPPFDCVEGWATQRRFPELRRGPPAKGEKVGHPAGTPVTCVATSGRQGEPRRPAALAGLLKELADVTVPAEGAGLDRGWRSCRQYCRS